MVQKPIVWLSAFWVATRFSNDCSPSNPQALACRRVWQSINNGRAFHPIFWSSPVSEVKFKLFLSRVIDWF